MASVQPAQTFGVGEPSGIDPGVARQVQPGRLGVEIVIVIAVVGVP